MSDIAKVDDIELQEIMENAVKSTEDLIIQLEGLLHDQTQFEHPLHKVLGLEKELRSIRGLLKMEKGEKGSVGRMHREGKVQSFRNQERPRIR